MELEEQYDKIYRYCYMKIRHQQVSEDITQETFLRFLENYKYREMGKKMAYLYTIARNLCTDYFRKKGTMTLKEDMLVEEIEDTIIQSMELKQVILQLDPKEQELIFLRYVNEVPVNQISAILGLSRFSVYRKTKECLNKLKQELGKEEFF